MKISMNRDISAPLEDDIFSRIGKKEIITILLIIIGGTAITMFGYLVKGIPISEGVNAIIPYAVVVGILGFYERDDMSLAEIAIRYICLNPILYRSTETPAAFIKELERSKHEKDNRKKQERRRNRCNRW